MTSTKTTPGHTLTSHVQVERLYGEMSTGSGTSAMWQEKGVPKRHAQNHEQTLIEKRNNIDKTLKSVEESGIKKIIPPEWYYLVNFSSRGGCINFIISPEWYYFFNFEN